jgi:tRNA pseudouridine55 synthase
LHSAARRGERLEAVPRPIRVDSFELLAYTAPHVEFRVTCSGGTYVRVLLADVGRGLGCGAHLTCLRRTAIGRYALDDAVTPDAVGPPRPVEDAVAHLPRIELDVDEARAASQGSVLAPAGIEGPYAVFGPDASLVGIYRDEGAKARPEVVLAPA